MVIFSSVLRVCVYADISIYAYIMYIQIPIYNNTLGMAMDRERERERENT